MLNFDRKPQVKTSKVAEPKNTVQDKALSGDSDPAPRGNWVGRKLEWEKPLKAGPNTFRSFGGRFACPETERFKQLVAYRCQSLKLLSKFYFQLLHITMRQIKMPQFTTQRFEILVG